MLNKLSFTSPSSLSNGHQKFKILHEHTILNLSFLPIVLMHDDSTRPKSSMAVLSHTEIKGGGQKG